MNKFKKIMIIVAIVLVSLFVVGLCVSLFIPLGNSSSNNDNEKQPVYNIWQFPEEEKVGAGFTISATDDYTLNNYKGYFVNNDKYTSANPLNASIGAVNHENGGFAFNSTFYKTHIVSYTDGYPNLEVNTESNCYLHNFGVSFKCYGNTYQFFLRKYNGAVDRVSLDFSIAGSRYRYIDADINALYEDFDKCGYINFEIGQELINKNEYLFAFRYSTENVSVSFNTLNTGTIKLEDKLYYCAVSSTHTEEFITAKDAFERCTTHWIENKDSNYVYMNVNGGYDASSDNAENYHSFVTTALGSNYFNEVYWAYRDNVESVIDKYVPQV